MSEETQTQSVLLPDSKIAVFSADSATLDVARSLSEDWRFARVSVTAQEGDVQTAIAEYKDKPSPDLILVQSDNIDDGFTSALEDLAQNCDEGTAAIVVGPVNDVYLYRKLIDMGVSDYLVKPLEKELLANVIAKTLIDRLGVTDSRLISFIGAKGGVGTSALSQAAGWGIAEILNQKTLLLDVAGGWSVMSVGLGYDPSTTLVEAARVADNNDEDSLKRMIFEAAPRLHVLAHGGDVMLERPLGPEKLELLLDRLMAKYPCVVMDLSMAPVDLRKMIVSRSHRIVVATTATLPSLRLARALIQEIKDFRGGDKDTIDLLVNMLGLGQGQEVPKNDIQQAMDFEPSGVIDFDPKLFMRTESEAKRIFDEAQGRSIIEDTLIPILRKTIEAEAAVAEEGGPKKKKGGLFSSLFGGK